MEDQEVMRLSRGTESKRPRAAGPAPDSVRAVLLLMYVSAGLEVTGGLVAVLTREEASVFLVLSFAGAGLWVWMARRIRGGRRWARIMGTVLFVANSLLTLLVVYALLFTEPVGPEKWVAAFSVVRWALALAIAVLVWTPEFSRYNQHTSRDASDVSTA
jgi:hypothetical protein